MDYLFGILKTIQNVSIFLNFYDKSGKSPMYYALQQFVKETQRLNDNNVANLMIEEEIKEEEKKEKEIENENVHFHRRSTVTQAQGSKYTFEYLLEKGASSQFSIINENGSAQNTMTPLAFALTNQYLHPKFRKLVCFCVKIFSIIPICLCVFFSLFASF